MTKLTTEVRLSDSADWQELLAVMSEHLDELPAPVRQGLEALSNGEALVWDRAYIEKFQVSMWDVDVLANGAKIFTVVSCLPLRRGYVDIHGVFRHAATLSIMHKGKVLAGW